jgi:hypothetical protein
MYRIDKTDAIFVLVGSKSDLEHLRTVRLDSHTRFAQEFGIPLSFVVSAKSGESVCRFRGATCPILDISVTVGNITYGKRFRVLKDAKFFQFVLFLHRSKRALLTAPSTI